MHQDDERDIPRVFRVEERRAEIARILEAEGNITVDRICEQFDVSAVTARNDLNVLERRGRLQRVHGGALPVDHTLVVADINHRMSVNIQAKRAIAQKAATMVREGDSIFVDAGSTTFEFVKCLEDKLGITIVTHDLAISNFVESRLPGATLILTGGQFRRDHGYCCGPLTCALIDRTYVDKAFVATNSFSEGQGFMTEYELAAQVKTAMLTHANQRIMLMDSSKVGLHNFVRFAGLDDVDCIVMERDPDNRMRRLLMRQEDGPELVLA